MKTQNFIFGLVLDSIMWSNVQAADKSGPQPAPNKPQAL